MLVFIKDGPGITFPKKKILFLCRNIISAIIFRDNIILSNIFPDLFVLPLKALDLCNEDVNPNIYLLIKELCTLPVSTTTPERMFSILRRIKV